MGWPTIETFKRPEDLSDRDNSEVLYARAYLRVRVAIGLLGVALPYLLWWVEADLLKGDFKIRKSFSAYYHHGTARDIFVGALVVVGFMLITYVAGRLWSWDFLLSAFAGVMALGVAGFPTVRSSVLDAGGKLLPDAVVCTKGVEVPGCTPLQSVFGELEVGHWHGRFALLFIGSLAAICFLSALRERIHRRRKERATPGVRLSRFAERFHVVCGTLMVLGGLWYWKGSPFTVAHQLVTPVYAAEFISVHAFGASWMLRGFDLVKQVGKEVWATIWSLASRTWVFTRRVLRLRQSSGSP